MIAAERIARAGDIDAFGAAQERHDHPLDQRIELLLPRLVGDDHGGATGGAGEIAGFVMRENDMFGRRDLLSRRRKVFQERLRLCRFARHERAIGDGAAMDAAAIAVGPIDDGLPDLLRRRAGP